MHTGIQASRAAVVLAMLLISAQAEAQVIDTLNIRPFERYWTEPRLVPKIGFGMQEAAFAEVGIQWHKIYIGWHSILGQLKVRQGQEDTRSGFASFLGKKGK